MFLDDPCMPDLLVTVVSAYLHGNVLSEVVIIIPILQMRKAETQRGVTCSSPHSK